MSNSRIINAQAKFREEFTKNQEAINGLMKLTLPDGSMDAPTATAINELLAKNNQLSIEYIMALEEAHDALDLELNAKLV